VRHGEIRDLSGDAVGKPRRSPLTKDMQLIRGSTGVADSGIKLVLQPCLGGVAVLEAQQQFRRIIGYHQLAKLAIAIETGIHSSTPNPEATTLIPA